MYREEFDSDRLLAESEGEGTPPPPPKKNIDNTNGVEMPVMKDCQVKGGKAVRSYVTHCAKKRT